MQKGFANERNLTQEEPETSEGAFEAIQNEHADFFDIVQGSDTTGA